MGGSQSALGENPIPPDSLDFIGRNGKIYANAQPFSIKGVNWFGSEAYCGPPNGLEKHNIAWYLDFLERHHFNAVRLLFNHEHILKNDIVQAPQSERLLFQVRYVDQFVVLAREAAKRGILVMIGCHRITHDAWPGDGLWYGSGISESRVLESWSTLARALCGEWNVFAADLQNEPHSASWGKGLPTDWNKAAEQIGDHVSSLCPRWMIMVEGVGYTPGAPGADDPGMGIWWGENLVGTNVAPVHLKNQDKLVYSPHVYGPSVYMQSYFRSPFFPNNMPAIWMQHFAFAQEKTGRPIVIGEFGGNYVDADRVWQDWAIPYIMEKGFGLFYFALNPDSKDTGGLVPQPDWNDPPPGSPEALKLEALSQLPSTDVFEVCPSCRAAQESAGANEPAHPPPMPPTATSSPPVPLVQLAPAPRADSVAPSPQPPIPPSPIVSSDTAAGKSPPPFVPPPTAVQDFAAVPAVAPAASFSTTNVAAIVFLILVGLHIFRQHRSSKGDTKPIAPQPALPAPKTKSSKKDKRKDKKRRNSSAAEEDAETERVVLLLQPAEIDPEDAPVATRAPEERSRAAEGESPLRLGERVRVHSLQQEPWHNGAEGVVAGHAQTPSGPRYNVVCQMKEGPSVGLCLKFENLQRLDDSWLPAVQPGVADDSTSEVALPVCSM